MSDFMICPFCTQTFTFADNYEAHVSEHRSLKRISKRRASSTSTSPDSETDDDDDGDATTEEEASAARWTSLAMVLGFNQLAIEAKTIGEKVFFRLAREKAAREYERRGGKLDRGPQEGDAVVLVLEARPQIEFQERDVGLLREYLRRRDEAEDADGSGVGAESEARRYRSDDRDLPGCDNDLLVYSGENGDWYLTIVKHGEKIGPTVRVTTSGTPRGYERAPGAVASLYRSLP